MGDGANQNERERLEAIDYDPRGRVVDPRPLDRFFYDRDKTQTEDIPSPTFVGRRLLRTWPPGTYARIYIYDGEELIATYPDDPGRKVFWVPGGTEGRNLSAKGAYRDPDTEPEKREYDRHRTMFWELLADYLNDGRYSDWYDLYYQKTADPLAPAEKFATHWPGYGQKDEGFPFGDTESDPAPLQRAPGLNVGPNQKSAGDSGEVTRNDLDRFHRAWDQTQEAFGAARGCYEVWTDIFVDVTDGFRGGYQNGDMRWIFKTPINEEFKFVEHLGEHLDGMKDGWTWTAIAGSKEMQCAGLGGLNWGRSSIEETYIDYNHADDLDGEHASDRKMEGGEWVRRDAADIKGRQVGSEADYGIVVKEWMGPIDSNGAWVDTEASNYSPGTAHQIWSQTKVGGSGGVQMTEQTLKDKIWSETKVGSGVTVTEQKTGSELYTKIENGGLSIEERISSSWVDTTIHGNDKETVHGNKLDHHFGNNAEMHLGANEALFIGAKAELTIGAWYECVIGVPGVVTGAAAGIAGGVATGVATGDSEAGADVGTVGAIAGGALGMVLAVPTEIFMGEKRELFLGWKREYSLASALEVTLGKKSVLGVDEVDLGATKKEYWASHQKTAAVLKFLGAKIDIGA
jgi:hypothetical protein